MNFNRRIDPEMELFWVNRLEPLAGPKLFRAMSEALEEERFPTLKRIIEMAQGRRDTQPFIAPAPLTTDERKRSDHAAIMSMLWLRYNYEHDSLGELMLKRLFPGDPVKALATAMEIYPKETVNRWMDDQQRAGN